MISFLDFSALAGLRQHVCHPTRGDNVLDLVLSSKVNVEVTVRDGSFQSDHCEQVFSFRTEKANIPLINRRTALNYRRADFAGKIRVLGVLHGHFLMEWM